MISRNTLMAGAPQQTGGGGYGFDSSMQHRQTEDGETMGSPAVVKPSPQLTQTAQAGLAKADAAPGGGPLRDHGQPSGPPGGSSPKAG